MSTTSKVVVALVIIFCASVAQAQTPTPTPFQLKVANRSANCAALSDSAATFIGSATERVDLSYWADTGPIFCAYIPAATTPTVSAAKKTPGSGWNRLTSGSGANVCKFPDQNLACFGASGIVCWDQAGMVTATPTPTPS